MNIASIDIGSNTVLLLIAKIEDNKLVPLINLYESPRLGKGLKPGCSIQPERINDLMSILSRYKQEIIKYNCQNVILTATNAMRIANNSSEIIEIVKKKLGFTIKIISGEEEAKLSFLGATYDLSDNNFPKTVVDIGGGSTEIIYGNEDKIIFKKSFGIGVVNLTEHFSINDFEKIRKFYKIDNFLQNTFKEDLFVIPPHIKTIAVAGTPTTLSCIIQNLKYYDDSKVEGSQLTSKNIDYLLEVLSSMTPYEIKAKFGNVVKGREDVILAGTIILKSLIKLLDIYTIYVSSKGLRYGNIISYLNNLNNIVK